MENQIKHKIGLVLDGGGGKGAYQIGVWKALKETGLDRYVTDIAGTSAGGLNAALFVKGNLEEAEYIWTKELSRIHKLEIQMGVNDLIDEYLPDMSFFENSPVNCFLTATNMNSLNAGESYETTEDGKSIRHCTAGKAEYFNMRFLDDQTRKETLQKATMRKTVLLATSALPVLCRSLEINGDYYRDGGLSNNSPVYPLFFATKCDTIIVIHLKTEKTPNKKDSSNENVGLLEIVPSGDTGGLFGGTINFNTEHAKELIKMGYNDSIKPLKKLVKNWEKQDIQLKNNKEIYQNIDQLPPEDKYRLYNECEFLVRGNYAKINYITEDGFGKTILRVVTGNNRKVKKQILENTQALHEKMLAILECLDDEMLNMRIGMDFLLDNQKSMGDSLISCHLMIKYLAETLDGTIKHIKYTDEFLKNQFPEFEKWNTTDPQNRLDQVEKYINVQIERINEQNQKLWELQQAKTAKAAQLKSSAQEHRILRITPEKAFVISYDFITDEQIDSSRNYPKWNIVDSKVIETKMSEKKCDLLVLPEDSKHPDKIKTIRPSDYFMFLWFVNTPVQDRAGKSVCMIDFYDGYMRVYGYEVNADGADYSPVSLLKKDNQIHFGSTRKYLPVHIFNRLGHNKSFLIYRTFTTSNQYFEERLNEKAYIDIKVVDPDWEKVLTENDGELFAELIERLTGRIYE